jgi:hypothetical protein
MDLLSQSVKIADLASNGHLSELLAKNPRPALRTKKLNSSGLRMPKPYFNHTSGNIVLFC